MVDSEFNPIPGDIRSGKRKKGGGPLGTSSRPVEIAMVWKGSEAEARAFGRLMKHLIADLDGTPDRTLVLKLRRAWLEGCEKALVADA